MPLRILFLSDSHLGFDLPLTPRVRRRRRGHDFLANFRSALVPALSGRVDMVVHGGDLFHRARPHPTLVAQAFEPLRRIADAGVPVFVVPGNHERSRIPHARFGRHPLIHIFDRPRCYRCRVRRQTVALLGFPYERRDVRRRFPVLVDACGWRASDGDPSFLCVHHCFEGATVGPANHTFRHGPDVIRCQDIPRGLTAILTGHVHRHQVLSTDLRGRSIPATVIYAGSTERTAFAEMGEAKGTVLLELRADDRSGQTLRWRFDELHTRPMAVVDLHAGSSQPALEHQLRAAFAGLPVDAVLRVRVHGRLSDGDRMLLRAAKVRAAAPSEMNVDVVVVDEPRRTGSRPTRQEDPATQMSFLEPDRDRPGALGQGGQVHPRLCDGRR